MSSASSSGITRPIEPTSPSTPTSESSSASPSSGVEGSQPVQQQVSPSSTAEVRVKLSSFRNCHFLGIQLIIEPHL